MSPRSPPSTSRRGLLSLCAAGAAGLAGCSAVGRAFVRTLEYTDTDTGPEHVADRLHALW